jgi:L-arabinose isomerase
MRPKPKVGLLFLAAQWFWEQNIQGTQAGRYGQLSEVVEAGAEAVAARLRQEVELVEVGIVHTVDQAREAARKLRAADLDLLVICSLIWAEDDPLITVLQEIQPVPLLVWCYVPEAGLPERVTMAELFRRSGPVGAVQQSAPLKRMGKEFGCVCGPHTDDRVLAEFVEWAQAAQMAGELRRATIGILPHRCEVMSGTYTDEFRLLAQLGPRLKYLSVAQLAAAAEAVPEADLEAYLQWLRDTCEIVEVGESALRRASQLSLGLARLAAQHGLDALAVNDLDPELHEVLGMRPCLYVPEFFESGRVIAMEADVCAAVALLAVRRLTGQAPMYVEIFTFDQQQNPLLAGHSAMHDLALAEAGRPIRVVPDYEYCESDELEGAWMEFRGQPGPVTMVSLFSDVDGFKMVLCDGQSLAEGARLEGFPHMLIQLEQPVGEFFRKLITTGVTQHWAVAPAGARSQLLKLAAILHLRVVELDASSQVR